MKAENLEMRPSPCLSCTRVRDPRNCENKNCAPWRQWFIDRWEQMRAVPRAQVEESLAPMGVNVGGVHYAAPHRVREYWKNDPCDQCLCPKDLCKEPCALKRNWLESKGDAFI